MADSNLTVKISADVTSLQAQAAVAKAELSDLNATVKTLADEFVAASDEMKGSLAPQLEAAALKASAMKAELAALNAEMKASVHPEVTGFFGTLNEGIQGTTEKIEGLTSNFSAIGRLTAALSEFVMAGLAVDAVGETINRVAEDGENLLHLSQETGLTTEQLSGLKVMATETGTSFDEFTKLIQKLPGTMQEAAINPASKAGQAFAAMGIQVTGTNGQLLPMGDILNEVSAKLASYADGTNKTALETDIFGAKIGATLIPMLNQLGQVGLQGAIEKSDELNQTWTGSSAESAEQFESDMSRAKLAVEGITDAIVRGLLPALDWMAKGLAPTLDAQITAVQAAVAKGGEGVHGGAELPALNQQLANLEAQKKQLDDSIAAQSATAGGAAPGSVAAPVEAPKDNADWMAGQTDALDQQNALIEQNAATTAQANEEKLQNTVQYWQGVLAAGNLSSKEEAAAQDALAKAEMADRKSELSAGTSAMKGAATEQTQIASDAAAAQKAIADAQYQTKVSNWDAEVAQGKMTKAQEIQDEIAAQNQMYQAALAEMQGEVALYATGTAAKAKELEEIQELTATHNATIAKMNADLVNQQVTDAQKLVDAQTQAANATSAAWEKAFQPISQAFDSSINGILQGTQTLQQAELKAAQSIALAFIDAEAKKVVNFVAGEAMILARGVATQMGLTAAVSSGLAAQQAAKTAADATGRTEDVALGTAQINSSAGKAAAGAYSAVAGIPIVGPVLAPMAAATAYAGVMAFDVLSAEGGMAIPAGVNPLTQLHEKEMVLPAHIAQPLQHMIAGGNTSNNSIGGDTHMNFTQHINGGGGIDAGMLAKAGRGIMDSIIDLTRNGTLRLPGR